MNLQLVHVQMPLTLLQALEKNFGGLLTSAGLLALMWQSLVGTWRRKSVAKSTMALQALASISMTMDAA